MTRIPWSQYFMGFAVKATERASCPRKSVGAVLVRDNRILATGYNGAPSGWDDCTERGGCLMIDGHCKSAIHAEENAILAAANYGVSTVGAACYVTLQPCLGCFMRLAGAGVKKIRFLEKYGENDSPIFELASRYGISIKQLPMAEKEQ